MTHDAREKAGAGAGTEVGRAAGRIVRSGQRVRRDIRDLVLRTYRARGARVDGLGPVVEEVLRGVANGLAGMSRPRRDELLRQVFEGLAEAYAVTAEESRRAERWEQIEARITEAVSHFAAKAGEDIMNEFKNVADQVRDAGQRLKPKAKAAMHALDENVVEPATEAAAEGARKVKKTLGGLLAAAGEMLSDLSDTMREPAKAAGAKKKAGTKTGKKAGKKAATSGGAGAAKTNGKAGGKAGSAAGTSAKVGGKGSPSRGSASAGKRTAVKAAASRTASTSKKTVGGKAGKKTAGKR